MNFYCSYLSLDSVKVEAGCIYLWFWEAPNVSDFQGFLVKKEQTAFECYNTSFIALKSVAKIC